MAGFSFLLIVMIMVINNIIVINCEVKIDIRCQVEENIIVT